MVWKALWVFNPKFISFLSFDRKLLKDLFKMSRTYFWIKTITNKLFNHVRLIHRGNYQCQAGLQLIGFDLVVLLYANNNTFSCLIESNTVKVETNRTVKLPLTKSECSLLIQSNVFLSIVCACHAVKGRM